LTREYVRLRRNQRAQEQEGNDDDEEEQVLPEKARIVSPDDPFLCILLLPLFLLFVCGFCGETPTREAFVFLLPSRGRGKL
jgi:hypothetical protein